MVRIVRIIILICMAVIGVIRADSIRLQPGVEDYGSIRAVWIAEGVSDWDFGKDGILEIQNADTIKRKTFLLRWDSLAEAIGPGQLIDSVFCSIQTFLPHTGHDDLAWSGSQDVYVAPVGEYWTHYDLPAAHGNDGGPNWLYRDTTWLGSGELGGYFWTEEWATPGAFPADHSTDMDTVSIGTSTETWYEFALDPDIVQGWYENTDSTGMVFYMDQTEDAWEDGDAHQRRFMSPYYDTLSDRPILTVYYHTAGEISGATLTGVTK